MRLWTSSCCLVLRDAQAVDEMSDAEITAILRNDSGVVN
jgi:hypothetical protein